MAEEKKEAIEEPKKPSWLVLNLITPIEYQGTKISTLDLTGLKEMTGEDLNVIYDLYESMGGTGSIMQESTLRFAQVIASRATGYPMEAITKLKAKDSVALKGRVYRFFFLPV